MHKKKLFVVTATTLATLGLVATATDSAKANEVKDEGNTYWVVESGDTLSKISEKYKVDFPTVHANNLDKVSDANVIFVGQKLLVGGKDFRTDIKEQPVVSAPVETEVQPIVEEVVVDSTPAVAQEQAAPTVAENVAVNGEHPNRANRRDVESTNNYNTFTANGYLGAYQFDPNTWNSIASRHGLDAGDFSPANQDRMADIYANERYGGWANVPMSGGW